MSNIITKLTCEKCKKSVDTYISFGHSTGEYKWICDSCVNYNIQTFEYSFRVKYLSKSMEEVK